MSLRERKRARTRQALVDAAVDLFERNGYERTTVADIAAAAEIGTRTFFSYFPSKEDVLFPEADARLRATVAAIDSRSPAEGPAEVLVRALREVTAESSELTGRTARLRTRLMLEVPAVMGRGLQIQLAGQRQIARHLQAAYPSQLDAVSAAALAGALTGAVTGALLTLFEDPARPDDPAALKVAVEQATEIALSPWKRSGGVAGESDGAAGESGGVARESGGAAGESGGATWESGGVAGESRGAARESRGLVGEESHD